MRAGILLFHKESQSICVICRQKNRRHYSVLPGGGLENGESFLQAAQRELAEELALSLPTSRFQYAFDIKNGGRTESYFLVELAERLPLTISGEELERSSATNTYHPQWISLSQVNYQTLQPAQLVPLIIDYFQKGNL